MNAPAASLLRALPGALLCSLLLAGNAAAQTTEVSGETLRLPDYKIVDNPNLAPVEDWTYTRVGGFEVLSNASDRNTRRLLADFARFTQAMKLVWPAPSQPLASSTLILCGRQAKFDAFAPADAERSEGLTTSIFLKNAEQVAIVIDVETDRIAINPADMAGANVTGSAEYEVDHYQLLYREYVRYLISQSQVRPPIWVEEGLAQIVMDAEITSTALYYGKIESLKGAVSGGESADSDGTDPTANGDALVGERPFNAVLINRKLMPLEQFFAITADSPEAKNRLGNNLWAKQAYAFVHFCLFGEKLQHKEAFTKFVQRLAREPLSETLFKECFKLSYADMQKQLGGYIRHTRHQYQKYALQKGDSIDPKSIELRTASPAEIALIKGDALRLAGHHEQAFIAYRSAYLRRAREPALLAGLGLVEKELQHAERSRELLEAAVQTNAPRPSAYVELARLRFEQAANNAASGKFSAAQVASVLKPLFAARQHPPMIPEAYELIAQTWARSEVAPKPENLAVLDEGIRAFPRRSPLLFNAAQLYQQAGAPQVAASIARLGVRFAGDAATKAKFEQLLATLPATPANS